MAQLYFKYGTMNSGKSIEILKTAHNYEEQFKTVKLMTPSIDTRSGKGVVSSRIGLSKKADIIEPTSSVFDLVKLDLDKRDIDCILVDEAQFLTVDQVRDLAKITDCLNIPIMAFGLRTDFKGRLFEGSKALFELADKIIEIKTICWKCNKKATMNLRLVNEKPVYEGEQIQIGGNESYISVCRKHYFNYSTILVDRLSDL